MSLNVKELTKVPKIKVFKAQFLQFYAVNHYVFLLLSLKNQSEQTFSPSPSIVW